MWYPEVDFSSFAQVEGCIKVKEMDDMPMLGFDDIGTFSHFLTTGQWRSECFELPISPNQGLWARVGP